jgi:hypothetical protein
MLFQGVVSNPMIQKNQSGANPTAIMGPSGDVLVSELHGKYYNANINGGLYYASNAAAGAAFTIFSNAGYVGLALFNPASSGKNLSIVRSMIGMNANAATAASGWGYSWLTGAGAALVGTAAPISASTAITATRGSCIVGQAGNSVVTVLSAATLSTAMTWGRAAAFGTGTGAITTAWGNTLVEDLDGTMIVPPGTLFCLTSAILSGITAVGTLIWEELPVVGS